MKVSKKSWHYRWMKKIGFHPPSNLCAYFWTTVWSILVFPVIAAVALVAATLLLAPFWTLFFDNWGWQQAASVIGVVEIILLSVVLTFTISDRWGEERHEKYGYYGRKPDSMLKQWFKAKKQKVCPLIEYTNE